MQYQWTDGASQLTGDMSCAAPLGRFDWDHDAIVTAVSLESPSRDPDLRRASSSVSDILARDIGVGVNLERAPANDSNFAMREVDDRDVSRILRIVFFLLGIDWQLGDRLDRGLQNFRQVLGSEDGRAGCSQRSAAASSRNRKTIVSHSLFRFSDAGCQLLLECQDA